MVAALPSVRLLPPPGPVRTVEAAVPGVPDAVSAEAAAAKQVEPVARIGFRPEGGLDRSEAERTGREQPAAAAAASAASGPAAPAGGGLWTRLRELWTGLHAVLTVQEGQPGPDRAPASAVIRAYREVQAMAWKPRRTLDLSV